MQKFDADQPSHAEKAQVRASGRVEEAGRGSQELLLLSAPANPERRLFDDDPAGFPIAEGQSESSESNQRERRTHAVRQGEVENQAFDCTRKVNVDRQEVVDPETIGGQKEIISQEERGDQRNQA